MKYNEGDIVLGTVEENLGYGYRISLDEDVKGFMHNLDQFWSRSKCQTNTLIKIGKKLQFKVLSDGNMSNQLKLGLKQLTPNPWLKLHEILTEGMHIKGIVTEVLDYGCFVQVSEDIEGIVYVSDMDWVNSNLSPFAVVSIGEEIEVQVLDINVAKERLNLGIKQCMPNPWQIFADNTSKDDVDTWNIVSCISRFGIEVEHNSGVSTTIFESDIIGEIDDYSIGEKVTCKLHSIDVERERIHLRMV